MTARTSPVPHDRITGSEAGRLYGEIMASKPRPDRAGALGDAPSLAECVSAYTAPGPGGGHAVQPPEMDQIRQAVAHWLGTWAGLQVSAEELVGRV